MSATPARLQTERLILRPWQAEDQTPFATMCADPAVMEHFVAPLTATESAAMFERIRDHFARRGFGPWAVELPGEAAFIGFVGLIEVPDAVLFAPAVEAAWRLARPFWGRGYATRRRPNRCGSGSRTSASTRSSPTPFPPTTVRSG